MNKLFANVRVQRPKRNVIDLSHEKKLSCQMGKLYPVYMEEIVPGDKFRVSSEFLLRMAPLVAPIMHNVNVFMHYFYVPYRLVFDKWEEFITGGENGLDASTFPVMTINEAKKANFEKGTLSDYFGIPIPPAAAITKDLTINALPFRAYQMIYNEYYRDQNLTAAIDYGIGETVADADYAKLCTIRNRAWEKDYFTSALPWAQRGAASEVTSTPNYMGQSEIRKTADGTLYGVAGGGHVDSDAGYMTTDNGAGGHTAVWLKNILSIDTTINDLRLAVVLQKWLEKNARAGSRYIEQILSHFGVISSDHRLMRPEYLGGGKSPIVISEVLQTVDSAEAPMANMAGHGLSVGRSNQFNKYFEEFGIVLGVMSILPRTAYQQGLEKVWSKSDKFDFYWPEFANIGEQEVLNREVYHDYTTGTPTGVFGYQSRYAEYKYKQSSVHGDFRDTLDHWHMGRIFGSAPALNTAFVEANPTHHIFAVETESLDKLYVQVYNHVRAVRPMPVFGIPTL